MGQQSEDEGRGYLVGSVRDAHVEVRQVGFYEIANQDFQSLLLRSFEDGLNLRSMGRRKGSSLSLHTLG